MLSGTKYLNDASRRMAKKMIEDGPYMSAEDERAALIAWKQLGDEKARDRVIFAHTRFVMKMVQKLGGYGQNADDLFEHAMIGLLVAINRFDLTNTNRFSTFAQWWVKDELSSYILKNNSIIRGPQSSAGRILFYNLRREKKALGIEGLLTPEQAVLMQQNMISKFSSVANITVSSILESDHFYATHTLSADAVLGGGDDAGETLISRLPAHDAPIDDTLADNDNNQKNITKLWQAVDSVLDVRQRDIFVGRRLNDPVQTLEFLAARYGVSRERIRQIEFNSLKKVEAEIRALVMDENMDAARKLERHQEFATA